MTPVLLFVGEPTGLCHDGRIITNITRKSTEIIAKVERDWRSQKQGMKSRPAISLDALGPRQFPSGLLALPEAKRPAAREEMTLQRSEPAWQVQSRIRGGTIQVEPGIFGLQGNSMQPPQYRPAWRLPPIPLKSGGKETRVGILRF